MVHHGLDFGEGTYGAYGLTFAPGRSADWLQPDKARQRKMRGKHPDLTRVTLTGRWQCR